MNGNAPVEVQDVDKLYTTIDGMLPKGQPKSATATPKKKVVKKSVAQRSKTRSFGRVSSVPEKPPGPLSLRMTAASSLVVTYGVLPFCGEDATRGETPVPQHLSSFQVLQYFCTSISSGCSPRRYLAEANLALLYPQEHWRYRLSAWILPQARTTPYFSATAPCGNKSLPDGYSNNSDNNFCHAMWPADCQRSCPRPGH